LFLSAGQHVLAHAVAYVVLSHAVMATDAVAQTEFFENRIRPILIDNCYDCHGPDEASGKLRLDSKSGWKHGGEGGPAIVPGDPTASLLIRAVSYRNAELKMPPEDAGGKLTQQQIDDLITWVRQGAIDPRDGKQIVNDMEVAARDHWAFQPIKALSKTSDENPIDHLINRKLQEEGFAPTEQADTRTLIRRAVYDLHGLPPTAAQLETPQADFPKLVQRLLSSPRYGERWGRHWLDVARYSDAKDGVLMYGDDRIRPFAYTYRDYVIKAFNSDKPFDQFVREQLAADQLQLPEDSPILAAMGLLTLGRMFDRNRHDVIDDQIDVVSRGFLGLTVSCARCHDHKFDPIPTADYYSLYGVFASSIEPYNRPRIADVSEAGQAFEKEFEDKLKEVQTSQQTHYKQLLQAARERTSDYLVQVATTEPDITETAIFFLSLIPDQLRPQIIWRWRQLIAHRAFPDDSIFGPWHDLMEDPTLRPDAWKNRGVDQRVIDGLVAAKPASPAEIAQTYGQIICSVWKNETASQDQSAETTPTASDPLSALLISRDSPVWFPKEDVYHYLSRTKKDAYRTLLAQLDEISVKHKTAASRAMVLVDSEQLYAPVIFQRGDPIQRGMPVPRQFLKALSPAENRPEFVHGSGRLDLANAIASPDNPLTPRVWVNRVWMHHFGEPLVENAADFGLRTERPIHYELLDYLAGYFVKNGWKTKPLHELILSSQAWQRASRIPETAQMTKQLQPDPANRLVWHANRRRLDFEQMRDTMLAVSGKLDQTMFGRPTVITDPENSRRTVYAFVERQNIPAMVQTFDFANADTSTSRRVTTTVPQQALFAMNSAFMTDAARAFTTRVSGTDSANAVDRITSMYLIAFGRSATEDEVNLGVEFLTSSSMEQYAQVLLMSNELMFVD
jgi:hypothetical protein